MKNINKYFFILILLTLSLTSKSADWESFDFNHTYNFNKTDSFSTLITVYLDSTTSEGSETVYHLNQACTYYSFLSIKRNQQFLQQKVKIDSTGKYWFIGDQEFGIDAKKNVGESFDFMPSKNIEATIDSIYLGYVLGEIDSLKRIILTSMDTIIVSKKHGIIYFQVPNEQITYSLKGIQDLGLGESTLKQEDFIGYHVNDIYYYLEMSGQESYPGVSYFKSYFTKEIISRKILDDAIEVIVSVHQRDSNLIAKISEDTLVLVLKDTSFMDTILFTLETNHFLNSHNFEKSDFRYLNGAVIFGVDTTFKSNSKSINTMYFNGNGTSWIDENWALGVGLVMNYYEWYYSGGSNYGSSFEQLVGLNRNGTLYGKEFKHGSIINVVETSEELFKFMPNPVVDILNIIPNSSEPYHIKIYNELGILVYEKMNLTGEQTVNFATFGQGLYYVNAQSTSDNQIYKIVKI